MPWLQLTTSSAGRMVRSTSHFAEVGWAITISIGDALNVSLIDKIRLNNTVISRRELKEPNSEQDSSEIWRMIWPDGLQRGNDYIDKDQWRDSREEKKSKVKYK